MRAIIEEQGNGLPQAGDYVSDGNGLYEIVEITSRIQTGEVGSGAGNYVYALVTEADWSDCDESDEHSALVHLLGEGEGSDGEAFGG